MKRAPKRPVRRTVFLDYGLLGFILGSVLDDRYGCEQRGAMSDDWRDKYERAEKLLTELRRACVR